jgi:hypothetical protein
MPELPPELDLAPPYRLTVPRSAALTPASLTLKNTLWPTVFAPRRKGEPEDWTRARARWAYAAMMRVVQEARAARAAGEVRYPLATTATLLSPQNSATLTPPPYEFIASHCVLRPRTAGGTYMAFLRRA